MLEKKVRIQREFRSQKTVFFSLFSNNYEIRSDQVSRRHTNSIERSAQEGCILLPRGVGCYSAAGIYVTLSTSKIKPIGKRYSLKKFASLLCGINKLSIFAFQYLSSPLLFSFPCIFRSLIISEYLLTIKIFMACIRSNILVEKLSKGLQDKHYLLHVEGL